MREQLDVNGAAPIITKEQIETYKMQRVQECGQRLADLLKEYDCNLVALPKITQDGRIVADIQLVAN